MVSAATHLPQNEFVDHDGGDLLNLLSSFCTVLAAKTSMVHFGAGLVTFQWDMIKYYIGRRNGCEAEREDSRLHVV